MALVTDDLNQRVQARLNLLTGSRPSLKALDADDHARWLWDAVDSRALAVLATSWRERWERHQPDRDWRDGDNKANCPTCGLGEYQCDWPCAEALSVCREIGVEL